MDYIFHSCAYLKAFISINYDEIRVYVRGSILTFKAHSVRTSCGIKKEFEFTAISLKNNSFSVSKKSFF